MAYPSPKVMAANSETTRPVLTPSDLGLTRSDDNLLLIGLQGRDVRITR